MTILYILSLIAAKGVKMLNYIWSGLIAVSVLCALLMGNTADIVKRTHRKRSVINTAYSHNGRHNLPLVGNYENRS